MRRLFVMPGWSVYAPSFLFSLLNLRRKNEKGIQSAFFVFKFDVGKKINTNCYTRFL